VDGHSDAPEKPPSGLAITSLVLGILTYCLFIPAIPAIITGHMALGRIRREPDKIGGKGLAITGLVLGYFGLLLLVSRHSGRLDCFRPWPKAKKRRSGSCASVILNK
jgi:hypothetical protein